MGEEGEEWKVTSHVCEVLCHVAFFFSFSLFVFHTLNNLARHSSFSLCLFLARNIQCTRRFLFFVFFYFVCRTCMCTHVLVYT